MPRSPARDLSDRYDKNRGYFRNRDWLWRWRVTLSGVAIGLVALWAAADIVEPKLTAYGHTHGRLANVHAAYDDNCAACHVPHSPREVSLSSVLRPRDRWHDFTCEKCHAGPAHHASSTEAGQKHHQMCSNCHHDHEGRLNSLVRLSDADCTKCHANLAEWTVAAKAATPPYAAKVTNFVTDHPEFRSLDIADRPRTLKFSHALHMNPGAWYAPDGTAGLTVADVAKLSDPAAAERYRRPGQKDTDRVQLDCASCHKLDAGAGTPAFDKLKAGLDALGQPAKAVLPPRADGAYFLPVNFDAHCRACHPLKAPGGAVADKVVKGFDLSHRVQPGALANELLGKYLQNRLDPQMQEPARTPPGPGGRLDERGTDPLPAGAGERAGSDARALAARAKELLLNPAPPDPKPDAGVSSEGCFKCHTGTAAAIAPVPDRTVWFRHAKFNHASHRGASCATCHPGTYGRALSRQEADAPEPVQIKGAATKDAKALCAACHSPAGTKVKIEGGPEIAGGGARHACTDCHRYHHGDLPLQARGSETWTPKSANDLTNWLLGAPDKK